MNMPIDLLDSRIQLAFLQLGLGIFLIFELAFMIIY